MEDMQKRIDRDDLAQEKLDGIKVCLMTTRPPPGSSNGVFLWANFAVPMYRQCAILLPIERRSWAAQTPVEYHGRRIATRLAYIYIYIYIYIPYIEHAYKRNIGEPLHACRQLFQSTMHHI